MTALLGIVGFLVIFPLVQTVLQSFQTSVPGAAVQWGLDGWRVVLAEQGLQRAALNTILLAVVMQAIALTVAVVIAWLLARTNVPGARVFEFVFWLAFFVPSLTVTLSWILLLDPAYGLVNQGLRWLLTALGQHASSGSSGPLNIYSFWGIVWVHLVGSSVSVKVMVLTPAFRNVNSALEEASRVAGATTFRTVLRIFVPIMLPAIVAIEFLALMLSLEAFEVEQVLGTPIGLYVATTWIYENLFLVVPRYGAVAALAVLLILAATGLIFIQRWILAGRQYSTLTSHFQTHRIKLGPVRWIACTGLCLICALLLAVPMAFSLMGTFMKFFGFFTPAPWTIDHWKTAFADTTLLSALKNTLLLGFGTALGAVFIHSLIAYVIARTKFRARGALDFLTWMPFTVPGIVLSLALLTMFLQPLFRPVYGTMLTLVVALLIAGMPFSVQLVKANLTQLGNDLEEASRVSGGNWFRTYRQVVLPLISPTLVVVGVIAFIGAARNISQVALLSNSAIRPLSLIQLDYIAQGKYEVAAVIATLLLFVSAGLAIVARKFGYRGAM
jgi:iron(III) transport system permease protein